MRSLLCMAVVMLAAAGATPSASAAQIQGDYLEARTCDIYTGPCFAEAEAFTAGDQAVLAWHVTKGTWNSVKLNGLTVIGVVQGSTPLSHKQVGPTRAALIVDERANPVQRAALASLAKAMGGKLLAHVVATETAPIAFEVESDPLCAQPGARQHLEHGGLAAKVVAPGLVKVQTRHLTPADCICGNEVVYYPPLTSLKSAQASYTIAHSYQGKGLGSITWSEPYARSAFVGSFEK